MKKLSKNSRPAQSPPRCTNLVYSLLLGERYLCRRKHVFLSSVSVVYLTVELFGNIFVPSNSFIAICKAHYVEGLGQFVLKF